MDPLSIAANVVAIAAFAGKLVQNVGRFVVDTKEGPDNLSDFYETIRNLQSALLNISHVLKQRPRQLSFEKDHHHNIYQIALSCQASLERLDRLLPDMKDDPNSYDKIRLNIKMSLRKKSVQQNVTHISSYTQVLQLSLITLSLGSLWGTQRTQEQIQAEIRHLTDSIRSANLIPPKDDPNLIPDMDDSAADANMAMSKEIQAWRISADELAAAVSLYDPDQMSLEARAVNAQIPSDSGIGLDPEQEEDDSDPEPEHEDCPSRDVLQLQVEQNQRMVKQLVRCGIFLKASWYQRKGISWRKDLAKNYKVPFSYEEQVDMQEFLADILLGSEIRESRAEAKDILDALLRAEVARGEQVDQHRRCRLYQKLGCLYMDQGNVKQARKALGRAFEGRRKMQPMPHELVIESVDALVKALQLDQAFDEARGYMEWKRQEFPPLEPTVVEVPRSAGGAAELTSAYAWCKEKGFDVDPRDFRFEVCDSARGTSPLHLAVQEENLEVFREMIDHVVSFEHRDASFTTPLLLAATTRNRETTRILVERGAKVDVRDRNGMSPLHRCQSKSGGIQVAKELLKQSAIPPSSSPSMAKPDLINVPDMSGRTAFHMAVEKGNVKMAQFLLDEGANPDLSESFGKTGLYMACEKGHEQMVRTVLSHQASPNLPGPGLCTPLIAAIEAIVPINIKISMVEVLLEHGADPRIADADGQTAYLAARKAGFGSEIKRLLQKADVRRMSLVSSGFDGRRSSHADSFTARVGSISGSSRRS